VVNVGVVVVAGGGESGDVVVNSYVNLPGCFRTRFFRIFAIMQWDCILLSFLVVMRAGG